MALSLAQFIRHLEESGIVAGDVLKEFIPPNASPKNSAELALELVRKKKLTKYQAEVFYKGNAKTLVLGNYVLIDRIGAGGMGQVFKAEHRRMHRKVAIKMLPPNVTKDAAAIARFEREVTAAAKLRHPNIVAADDADCADGVHFLVMELVDGQDLSTLIKKNGPLSVNKAVNYILQAARGLEFAQKKGVVHRDVKPANLLLDNEGVVKILDLGLARLMADGDSGQQADLTSTGTIMGTADYMSPEQALDTRAADARADIYALGCSLFYLLIGKPMYDGDTLMKKLVAHREHPIPSLQSLQPMASAQLAAVFNKMVAKKVEDRYQTMSQVVIALEQCNTAENTSNVTSTTRQLFPESALKLPSHVSRLDATILDPSQEVTVLARGPEKVPAAKLVSDKKVRVVGGVLVAVALAASVFVYFRNSTGKALLDVDPQVAASAGDASPLNEPDEANDPVVSDVKERLFFQRADFDPWAKQLTALSAEQQLEAVIKKLIELNPAFDGKVFDDSGDVPTKIEDGVVRKLAFVADHVIDISPVRALVGLNRLKCFGSQNKSGRLADLSPLEGMKLLDLHCGFTNVSDLSPLRDMPLLGLSVFHTQVTDLSPLAGLPLEYLDLGGVPANDFSPVAKCEQLRRLIITETSVAQSDVDALQTALKNCTIQWSHPANSSAPSP